MIISPIDNLITVAQAAASYNEFPSGTKRARLQMALANLDAIPGTGSGPQRAADALQHLATQLNRLAAQIGYPGPQWDPVGFPDLAAALLGYSARIQIESVNVQSRTDMAINLIGEYGGIDGAHHKQWVLDQTLRTLAGDRYADVVSAIKQGDGGEETYDWKEGMAP